MEAMVSILVAVLVVLAGYMAGELLMGLLCAPIVAWAVR